MAKLTKTEQRLLEHPPTPGTWICSKKRKNRETGETAICNTPNSAKARECWLCRSSKPSKAKLLWPTYVGICKKAGVTPKGGA